MALERQYGRRASPASVTEEITVPAGSGTWTHYLDEKPYETSPSSFSATELSPSPEAYLEVSVPPTAENEFYVDYDYASITFYKGEASRSVQVAYDGLGTVARSEWANMMAQWQSKSLFLTGIPEAKGNPAEAPNAIMAFPAQWTIEPISIATVTGNAQTALGLSGNTTVRFCNCANYEDDDADYIDLVFTDTGASSDYWTAGYGDVSLIPTDLKLYVRVLESGGHGNIQFDVMGI